MSRLHHPGTDEIDLISVLHALADPVRLSIVTAISDGSEHPCGRFEFGISKASMSHHFRVLRESGVTTTRQDGKHRLIALRDADLERRFPGVIGPLIRAAREAARPPGRPETP